MGRGSRSSLRLAAVNHDGAGTHVFLLINAQLADLRTIKHCRHERISGLTNNCMVLLRLRGERAKAQQRQKGAGEAEH